MICYSRHCVEIIINLVLASTKVKWFALYQTNLSHEVPLSFVWLKFSSFGWDINTRRIRIGKTLSLGMPRKASSLSSSTLSVYLTWSYIFIHHMICVLLGVYFHFTSCLNKIIGLNDRESSHGYLTNWLCIDLHLYLFGVVLSFTSVFHLYPMSKWLNELNIINLKLYMLHMLIRWE